MRTDFKIGDRVEMLGLYSSVPQGTRGEIRMIREGDAGVWWEGWAHGHDFCTCGGDQGLPGWVVDMNVLCLLESAENLQWMREPLLPRRKLFIEEESEAGVDQAVRYFCKPGDVRRTKEK